MQIYYINIAGRTDRRAFIESQFERLGLAATRIAATTPADLTDEMRRRWCDPRRRRWLTPSELSCSLSHLEAMRAMLDAGLDRALILEDDCELSLRVPRFLASLERQPPPAGLVRLETTLGTMRLKPYPGPHLEGVVLSRLYGWADGAGAYVVTRAAAETIVASRQLLLRPADQALFNPFCPLPGRVGLLQANPGLAVQTMRLKSPAAPSFGSDIEDRNQRGHKEGPHVWRRLPYRLANALERDIVVGLQKVWHEAVGGAKKHRVIFAPD